MEEGSYIKMIDMVSGSGGQIQVKPIIIIAYFIYSFFNCLYFLAECLIPSKV